MSGYEEISYSKQHKKQKNMLFFKQRQTNYFQIANCALMSAVYILLSCRCSFDR